MTRLPMITIEGRHIRKAMVERRCRKTRTMSGAGTGRGAPCSPADHVWTVSAMGMPLTVGCRSASGQGVAAMAARYWGRRAVLA